MDFVAIDFETANGRADSACQLAAVVVQASEIVAEHCWLIRPPRGYFSPRNIEIHGIRPKDVADAPNMEQVWESLAAIVDGQVLVAHNARFDLGVLIDSLAAFDVACPELEFTCTRLLARCAWPGRSRYGLKPLGSWLGIEFQHHDALEDARCCAQIAIAIEKLCEENDLQALEQRLRITRGCYRQGQLTSPRRLGRRKQGWSESSGGSGDRWGFPSPRARRTGGAVDPSVVIAAAAGSRPLAGKYIFMLGSLRGLDSQKTIQLLTQLGASCQSQINSQTDYVVACGTSLDQASQLVCSSLAREESEPTRDKAAGIRLLSERQFLALLPGGKASVRW